MIKVALITNSGAGDPVEIPVVNGTILEDFLALSFEGDPEDFKVRVRTNGDSHDVDMDYVLQDGDRVSMSPRKVDGAR